MAECWENLDELLLCFEDSVRVEGPAELVYDFLYRIGEWSELLPHVEWTSVVEDVPGIQLAAVDSCGAQDGQSFTTHAVRLCFPHAGRIVFQETLSEQLIAAHSGEWSVVPEGEGVRAVSEHRVLLRAEAVEAVLGPGADLALARREVRERLGRAAVEALQLAQWHAQSAVRRLH
ncbi:SRPBCC family protein [Streptomyces sp. SAS_270]|uniref:SRPBCC family protein n=1 Tax=Streptomyces sp. SAS_270 TaxID=3412748 RepID=UPI00403D05BC